MILWTSDTVSSRCRLSLLLLTGLVVGGVSGCGGSSQNMLTAAVSGTVTVNGQPVTGGGILFSPIVTGKKLSGKPSAGPIQPDGTFSLTTYEAGDGAVIGMHQVVFSPPPATVPDAPAGAHVPAGARRGGRREDRA